MLNERQIFAVCEAIRREIRRLQEQEFETDADNKEQIKALKDSIEHIKA